MPHNAGLPAPPALHIIRLPGEPGTVVRCAGELTLATGEALRRELDLVASSSCRLLILNVALCRSIDPDGFALLLEMCRRLLNKGVPFALVAAREAADCLAAEPRLGAVPPVYSTEAEAVRALQGAREDGDDLRIEPNVDGPHAGDGEAS